MTKIQKQRLCIEFVDEITIVRLLDREIHQGFCELDDAEAVSRQIDELVRSARPKYLLLDLSEVEYMATFMQAFLIELQSRLRRNGGRLTLCGLREYVELSFRITNLHQLFAIYADERSAFEAFDAGR